MKTSILSTVIGIVAAAFTLSGCMVQAGIEAGPGPGHEVVADDGTMTLSWTVNGFLDSDECWYSGATDMELAVYDYRGNFITEKFAACEAMQMTVALPDGTYYAEATLVDEFDDAMSDTLVIDDVDIIDGTDLEFDIDMPTYYF